MQLIVEFGGKGKVIKFLKEKFYFKKIVMIGDGVIDMEVCFFVVCIKWINIFSVVFLFQIGDVEFSKIYKS